MPFPLLRHRSIVILFLILLGILIAIDLSYTVSFLFYVLLFLVFLTIEFYGAYHIGSNFHLRAICQGASTGKLIALTFDDGPASQTEAVLKTLQEFEAKATFFCIGRHIQGNTGILKKMDAAGHLIANHSFSHSPFFDFKSRRQMMEELEQTTMEIRNATGRSPLFFRPPFGVTTPAMSRAVGTLGLTVIGWNIRSLDTSIKDREKLVERIKSRVRPGAILLMHDRLEGIETVLKELLIFLKKNNYKVVPLDQLINKKAYA